MSVNLSIGLQRFNGFQDGCLPPSSIFKVQNFNHRQSSQTCTGHCPIVPRHAPPSTNTGAPLENDIPRLILMAQPLKHRQSDSERQ